MDNAQESIKVVNGIWEQLIHAPAHLLLIAVLILFGVLIKKSPTPNWTIPWILILFGVLVYPFLASPKNINPDFPNPQLVLRIYGGLLAVVAIVAHIFLKKWERWRMIEYGIINAFRDDEDKVVLVAKEGAIDPTKPSDGKL